MNQDNDIAPWYRQPWLWFLIMFPVASIMYCAVAITAAVTSNSDMVSDDYSKEGRAINQERARDDRAAAMGLKAHIDFSGSELELTVDSTTGQNEFPYLILNLFHPTLEARDRTIQLKATGGGHYVAHLPRNVDGRWYVDLRGPSNDWRLKGQTTLPATKPLELDTPKGHG